MIITTNVDSSMIYVFAATLSGIVGYGGYCWGLISSIPAEMSKAEKNLLVMQISKRALIGTTAVYLISRLILKYAF